MSKISPGACAVLGALLFAVTASAQTPAPQPDMKVMLKAAAEGARTWAAVCESCHGPPNPGTPARTTLLEMTAGHIYEALTTGKMKPMGDAITDSERRSVAMYLTGKPLTIPPAPASDAPPPAAVETPLPAPGAPPVIEPTPPQAPRA